MPTPILGRVLLLNLELNNVFNLSNKGHLREDSSVPSPDIGRLLNCLSHNIAIPSLGGGFLSLYQ